MPEGHTIHALARQLERALGGEAITGTSPQGRFAADAARLDGHILDRAEAVGKHLFVDIGPHVLHVHLGLIGTFHVKPLARMPLRQPAPTVRLRLVGDTYAAELRGPMICALIDEERRAAIEARLGPDPLDPRDDPDRAWARIHRSRKAIGELLMDQAVVAGVGNVYRCEVLHRLKLDPFTPGRELDPAVWQGIWEDLRTLMPLGMAFSQILTMQDQVDEAQVMMADGSARAVTEQQTGERLGDCFERRFHVYQRAGEPCRRCGAVLQERKIGGRTLYWCPACQTRT
ncbi:MAG: Fpg/Nei family DNA glycosylase [Micrococcales bacterium]|nr:Fpg/Nei family DNA glycosylase [Micrococcales bacterium]